MSTKFDAVCLALTTLWQATLSGTSVVDGPQADSDPVLERLFVGHDGDVENEGTEVVAAEQDFMAFAKVEQESPDVTCAVIVRDGSANSAPLRGRACEIFNAATAALKADLTLGGLVMQAHVSSFQYIPSVTTSGSLARVVFTVTYLAQL